MMVWRRAGLIIFSLMFVFLLPACQTLCDQCFATPPSSAQPDLPIVGEDVSTDALPNPQTTCLQEGGEFQFHEIQTALMTHLLYFRVYLPPCYAENSQTRYPVLYLLHGQGFNDDQWDRLGADDALASLLASGEISPFIIVMPRESNYMNDPLDSKFGPAIAQELIPWIDAHYRTCAERSCRAIGGISRGSAWAMRTGLLYWQTFGIIGAHSFPPFRGDFNAVPIWLREMGTQNYPQVWIDIGTLDPDLDAARVFMNRLEEYAVPLEWHVLPGGHTEAYWAGNMQTYLRWYAQAFQQIVSISTP